MAVKRPFRVRNEERAPWDIRGGAMQMLTAQNPEVILSGPAGTGKSVASLLKMFVCAESVPRMRGLMIRKTRESLTESALVTWEQKIVPPGHLCLKQGGQRRLRQSYRFSNGSEVIVGGLDKPSKIMSTEFDLIYVQEAIELREEDWEALSSRLRNGRMKYQQIYGDTNPDAPSHWLKQRCDAGRCLMIESRHEDNPYLFDRKTEQWTVAGTEYLAKLDALTGPRYERLRLGRWAQAEGVVYKEWDRSLHLVPGSAFAYGEYPPPDWPRYWAVDFGYTNPFVCLFCALDHDGRLWVYREIYHTQRLVQDHAAVMMRLWRDEAQAHAEKRRLPQEVVMRQIQPRSIVCDHDAEDRATLERHLSMPTTAARKFVKKGVQLVSERLRRAGDGKPRIFVLDGGILEEDLLLRDAKRPVCLADEMDCYIWNPGKDEPLKVNDHAADALRYLVCEIDGGMSSLWEPATYVSSNAEEQRSSSATDPQPRLRFGEMEGRLRRGARLFGRGGPL